MNNIILSTKNIDDLVTDVANEVVRKMELYGNIPRAKSQDEDKLLTVQEAGELLKLTVPTIYSKVSKSELPVMKRGKRLLFSRAELMEYMKAGRRKTLPELKKEAEEQFLEANKKGGSDG